jgi:hypothetical protein
MPASLGRRSLNYGSLINWAAPLNRGLLAWWLVLPMWARTKTWHDLTGRYDGTLTNMGASSATSGWGTTRRPGGYGDVRFDGTDDLVVPTAIPQLSGLSAFTYMGWLRHTTLTPAAEDGVYSQGLYPTGVLIEAYSDGYLYCYIGTTLGRYLHSTADVANQWFHLTWVYNGTAAANADRLICYHNGLGQPINLDPGIPATLPATGGAVQLGRTESANTRCWQGGMDDVRLYNRALSHDEVRALYVASATGYQQELAWQVWPHAQVLAGAVVLGKAGPPRRQPWRFFRRAA